MGGSFFDKAKGATKRAANIEQKTGANGEKEKIKTGSNLGREITRVETARTELFKKSEYVNPVPYIEKAAQHDKTFYGLLHTGDKEGKPFFLNDGDTTHEIYVGSTGTGKGVLLGNKTLEAMKKKKGVIIIDPKKDAFLPQICKDELERQGRPDDFQVCSFPNNFGYMGINEFDTYIDISNKFIDALDLQETGNAGVDYYKKNQRVLLRKVLKLFFDGDFGVIVKKNFTDILFHLKALKEDLEKQERLEKEQSKIKQSANVIAQCEKRFFALKKIEAVYWDNTTIETLDSLVKSVAEIAESANIYKNYDLTGALYEGKVLYLKVDMLDAASLKMTKMLITDAIQQARRKKANTVIIADELSFYANQTIAGALATVRSMGLKFLLALQDLAQMKEEHIRNAILSNCNVKMFYKISDKQTLEYVEKTGGKEAVTAYGVGSDGDYRLSQQTEEVLNATRIRAMPRQSVGILMAEALPESVIVRTNFVKTIDTQEFAWEEYDTPQETDIFAAAEAAGEQPISFDDLNDKEKLSRYKIEMEEVSILENSDLFGISYTSKEISGEGL